jgi:hypothetical protein
LLLKGDSLPVSGVGSNIPAMLCLLVVCLVGALPTVCCLLNRYTQSITLRP